MNPTTNMSKFDVANEYHKLLYKSINWRKDLLWHGIPIFKNPNDLFLSQMLIHEIRPNTIIETGTAYGGSAMFYHEMMSHYTTPNVISVDNLLSREKYIPRDYELPEKDGITYVFMDSVKAAPYVEKLKYGNTLIFLDSDHTNKHVFNEMMAYHSMVTPGSYLIVEDANTHIVLPDYDCGNGPAKAVQIFMDYTWAEDFTIDRRLETRFGFSFNLWLKKNG